MSATILASCRPHDGQQPARKRVRCSVPDLTTRSGVHHLPSFFENVKNLQQRFPEVPEGVVTSVLESSNNNEYEAESLILHVCEASADDEAVSSVAVPSWSGRTGLKRRLDICVSPNYGDLSPNASPLETGNSSANDIRERLPSCSSSPQGLSVVGGGSVETSLVIQNDVDCKRMGNTGDPSPEDATSANFVEGFSRTTAGDQELAGYVQTLRTKLQQAQNNQLVLARAVRSQFMTLRESRMQLLEKTEEASTARENLGSANLQLAKLKDAHRSLQYFTAAVINSTNDAQLGRDFLGRFGDGDDFGGGGLGGGNRFFCGDGGGRFHFSRDVF